MWWCNLAIFLESGRSHPELVELVQKIPDDWQEKQSHFLQVSLPWRPSKLTGLVGSLPDEAASP
jgi:hypothetical protein